MKLRLIAGTVTGAIVAMHSTWWLGLAALVLLMVWTRPTPTGRLLMTLDTETGVISAEPNDKLTEEYLRKRGS